MKNPPMCHPAEDLTEIDLLCNRAQSGDDQAFEVLYRKTVGAVYGLCLRMTANPAHAEECTQQTFVKAWQRLNDFRGESKITTWLHRIAVNEVLGAGRREGRYREVMGEFGVVADLQQATASSPDVDLENAIAHLPERPRQVFVLHAVYGYRHDETAKFLDIATGTSKTHYHRAKELLRVALGDSDVKT